MTPDQKQQIEQEAAAEYPIGENHFFAKRQGYERAVIKYLCIIDEKDREIERLKAIIDGYKNEVADLVKIINRTP